MATNEIKTWTEIKLRNPRPHTCEQVNIMMGHMRELSASKAVERLIDNYSRDKNNLKEAQEKILALNNIIRNTEAKLSQAEDKLFNIGRSYKAFTDLIAAEIPVPPVELKQDRSKKFRFEDDVEREAAQFLGLGDLEDEDEDPDDWTEEEDD